MHFNPHNFFYILMGILLFNGCAEKSSAPIDWKETTVSPIGENQGLAGALTGISQQKLILAGGANFPDKLPWDGGQKQYHSDLYIFSFQEGGLVFENQKQLPAPRAYAANTPYKNGFVSAGGENTEEILRQVDYFYIENDSLHQKSLPDLPIALTNGTLVSIHNELYFLGGENKKEVSDKVWQWTDGDSTWTEYATLVKPITHAVVLANEEGFYIIGGRQKRVQKTSEIFAEVYFLDTKTKKLSELPSLPQPMAAGTGVLGPEGIPWLFGGDDGSAFTKTEELILAIENEQDPETKQALIRQKDELQKKHPGFNKNIYSFKEGTWVKEMEMPFALPVTTTALSFGDFILIPNGEIRAGVRSHKFLIGKWQNK